MAIDAPIPAAVKIVWLDRPWRYGGYRNMRVEIPVVGVDPFGRARTDRGANAAGAAVNDQRVAVLDAATMLDAAT